MTMTLGFPSADFPGPPPFRFELPQGWTVVPSVNADAVVVSPTEADGVRPNVVITNHKVRATEDPETLLRDMIGQQLTRDDVIDVDAEIETAGAGSRSCSVRFGRLVPASEVADDGRAETWAETADLIPVQQTLNLCYVPGPHLAYVLAATGTYGPDNDEGRRQVDAVVRSVKC